MKLFNNPEIRKFLLITVIPSLLLCFIVFFFSEIAAVCVFLISAFLIISFLIFTRQRYVRISKLEENIDKIPILGTRAIRTAVMAVRTISGIMFMAL